MEPELKLNSLDRFKKQSPTLTLEEYSSCEVPAGCGGVVLRWIRPHEPVPVVIRSFHPSGKYEQWIDGQTLSSKVLVSSGQHALTLTVREFDPEFAVLIMSANMDANYVRILRLEGDTSFLSADDGTWRYSFEPPSDDNWRLPDFDDRAWPAMIEKPFGPLPKFYGGDIDAYTRKLTELGAVGIGVTWGPSVADRVRSPFDRPSPPAEVYIRKTFSVVGSGGTE